MVNDTLVLHVPYRGTGPQLTDLRAGRLDAASVDAPAILVHIKSGTLRCIAAGTKERLAQLPNVATVAEGGSATPPSRLVIRQRSMRPLLRPNKHAGKS